jgi:dihydroorotase
VKAKFVQPVSPSLTLALAALLLHVSTAIATHAQASYDLVVARGRVMDPESGLDAVRDIGIRAGKVAVISEQPLQGRDEIDAAGLVVAPGFVDIHAHGQDERSATLQAQDGVTTALDMELGVFPVSAWYASREGKARIHFGAAAGHIPARIALKHGIEVGHRPTAHAPPELETTLRAWSSEPASAEELERLCRLVDRALDDGALGIGMGPAYTPGASREEIFRMFQVAARRGATVFVHLRSLGEIEPASSIAALQEVLADAAASGASLHVLHVTSSGLRQTPVLLEMIDGARGQRVDVTVEAYPYTASSTRLASALFDTDWQRQRGISYGDLQWSATGERLTKESFEKYRKQDGWVIIHMIPEAIADLAIEHPLVMVASDGIPFETGGEHPRGAGTFSRILGRYVRERGRLSLMDALRKMTLMPAQRLEGYVPQMKDKGRLRSGANADITIFDPATVADRATYDDPMQPSAGIVHVIVGGRPVVRQGKIVEEAFPGQAVRNQSRPSGL